AARLERVRRGRRAGDGCTDRPHAARERWRHERAARPRTLPAAADRPAGLDERRGRQCDVAHGRVPAARGAARPPRRPHRGDRSHRPRARRARTRGRRRAASSAAGYDGPAALYPAAAAPGSLCRLRSGRRMKKANKLKDDARRHELREDWDKAIQAYQRVLELGESEGDVELPLYNRIGDLYVRVGRPTEAVRYYSQAADRYADAGLYNNAIALCNKALRYAPENLDLLRKLGQFSAAQGFLTDARRWFLDYAESAARQGRIEEALQALEDFANSTEDAEIRELFGRTLHQHDQHERAVTELRQAYRLYLGAGDSERAQALAAYLREIAPDISLADEQPMTRSVRGGDDDDYVIRPYAPSGEAAPATAEEGEGAAPPDAAGEAEPGAESHDPDDAHAAASAGDGDSTGAGPLDDYVSTAITDGEHAVVAESDVLEGFQPTSFETEPEDESDAFELPPLETTQATELGPDDVAVALPGLEPTALGGDEEEEPVVELPVLDTDTDDDADVEDTDDVFIELPTLDESEEAVPEANDDRDEEGASFDLPTLAADETTDEER